MKLVVTGGAGFIGSNFIRHILARYPRYAIRDLDKLTYSGNRYTLRGYESATFVGVPDDPESPPTAEQLKARQEGGRPRLHLVSKFVLAGRSGIQAAAAPATQDGNK